MRKRSLPDSQSSRPRCLRLGCFCRCRPCIAAPRSRPLDSMSQLGRQGSSLGHVRPDTCLARILCTPWCHRCCSCRCRRHLPQMHPSRTMSLRGSAYSRLAMRRRLSHGRCPQRKPSAQSNRVRSKRRQGTRCSRSARCCPDTSLPRTWYSCCCHWLPQSCQGCKRVPRSIARGSSSPEGSHRTPSCQMLPASCLRGTRRTRCDSRSR